MPDAPSRPQQRPAQPQTQQRPQATQNTQTQQRTQAPQQPQQPAAPQPAPPAPFQIHKPSMETHYLKGLLYGPPGAGKTYLASSSQAVPEMANVLYCDVEAGELSLLDFPDIDVVTITSFAQLNAVHEFLKLHCRFRDDGDTARLAQLEARIKGSVPQTPTKYYTVVIDSLSEVQKYAMYQVLGVDVGTTRFDLEPSSPEFRDWNVNTEMIRLLIRTFRNLPMNVIFVCAEDEAEDDRRRRLYRPLLPGKLSKEVQGFVDFVGYYKSAPGEDNTVQRRLFLTPQAQAHAKHRFVGVTDTFIDNPTMASLQQLRRRALARQRQ